MVIQTLREDSKICILSSRGSQLKIPSVKAQKILTGKVKTNAENRTRNFCFHVQHKLFLWTRLTRLEPSCHLPKHRQRVGFDFDRSRWSCTSAWPENRSMLQPSRRWCARLVSRDARLEQVHMFAKRRCPYRLFVVTKMRCVGTWYQKTFIS